MAVPVNNAEKQDKKRRNAAAVAVICILALLLMGTWAYYNSVSALNRFQGETEVAAVLHDDYDKDGEQDEDGTMYHEKKVYVENAGQSSLIVRVTLEEYMEYLNESHPTGAVRRGQEKDDTETVSWHPHSYTEDESGNYICADCGELYHDYYQWILSGDDYQPVDAGMVQRFEPADVTYEYKPATEAEKAAGLAQRYEYDETSESWKDKWAGETLAGEAGAAEVVAMEEYLSRVKLYEQDSQDADGINPDEWKGWIMDTDGYVYWSQRLAPGETTGMLLSGVVLGRMPYGDNCYYAIDVVMEAVDDTDLDSWIDGTASASGIVPRDVPTDNALELLARLRQLSDGGVAAIVNAEAGDVVEIGESEWILLEKDEDKGTAVILSKGFVKIGQRYHSSTSIWQWSTSEINTYLNEDYYNNELDEIVRNIVVKTENKTNLPGAAVTTEDDVSEEYVYLLSYTEYQGYSKQLNGTIDFSASGPYPVSTNWWLRSPGTTTQAHFVTTAGTMGSLSSSSNGIVTGTSNVAVRPALTIRYK